MIYNIWVLFISIQKANIWWIIHPATFFYWIVSTASNSVTESCHTCFLQRSFSFFGEFVIIVTESTISLRYTFLRIIFIVYLFCVVALASVSFGFVAVVSFFWWDSRISSSFSTMSVGTTVLILFGSSEIGNVIFKIEAAGEDRHGKWLITVVTTWLF